MWYLACGKQYKSYGLYCQESLENGWGV